MEIHIEYQSQYSRSELLLRTIFGLFYIVIPHGFALFFYSIYVGVASLIAWFSILFTRNYPKFAFDAVTGMLDWQLRVNASMSNLVDGYPPFGPKARWDKAYFKIGYPEIVTRKRLLFASFLSWIVLIPQLIMASLYSIGLFFAAIYAWFSVLFTGKYPASVHNYAVGFNRFSMRINMYIIFLYFKYPEFTFEETETDKLHS